MAGLIWILAIVSSIGCVILGFGDGDIIWVAAGIVCFAILGGFASVIGLLKEISSNTADIKKQLAKLEATREASTPDSASPGDTVDNTSNNLSSETVKSGEGALKEPETTINHAPDMHQQKTVKEVQDNAAMPSQSKSIKETGSLDNPDSDSNTKSAAASQTLIEPQDPVILKKATEEKKEPTISAQPVKESPSVQLFTDAERKALNSMRGKDRQGREEYLSMALQIGTITTEEHDHLMQITSKWS